MKILHLLSAGGIGGIEVLCKDIEKNSEWDNYFCFLFGGGEITEEIDKVGGRCIRLYEQSGIFINKIRKLIKICKVENIDIICVHHGAYNAQLYYIVLKKFLPRKKYVKFLHSVFEKKYYYHRTMIVNKFYKYLFAKSIKISDKIIAVSNCVKTSFQREFNINENKIKVIYNGIDDTIIANGQKNSVDINGKIKMVYIGRLVEEKGISLLIEAIHNLKDYEDIKLTIVGDGKERLKFEALVRKYRLTENIKFVGFQRDVNRYLIESNIFIYPSICKEAFGISIVEAMAYGIPCIANESGGIPEIIINGENGFLARSNDVYGLCEAIKAANEAFIKNEIGIICENSKKTARKFTINNTINKLREEFEQLI